MEFLFDAIAQDIADRLNTGSSQRKSALHTPVVGTADGDLRVMVLREFVPGTHSLRFHTDSRSPKVKAVAADSRVSVLAYDPAAKVQIRMRGVGRVETVGAAVDAAWADSTSFAKRCYMAERAPSEAVDGQTSGLPEWIEGITPTEDQVLPGRDNFAILLIDIDEFDWLYLANAGHRRARLTVGDTRDQVIGTWLVP